MNIAHASWSVVLFLLLISGLGLSSISQETAESDALVLVLAKGALRTTVTITKRVSGSQAKYALLIPLPKNFTEYRLSSAQPVDDLIRATDPSFREEDFSCGDQVKPTKNFPVLKRPPFALSSKPRVDVIDSKELKSQLALLKKHGFGSFIQPGKNDTQPSYRGRKILVVRYSGLVKKQHYLMPVQYSYPSSKLGISRSLVSLNQGLKEVLRIFVLTEHSQVRIKNHRTLELPSGMRLPSFIKNQGGAFMKALIDQQVKHSGDKPFFLEYSGTMSEQVSAGRMFGDLGVSWIGSVGRDKTNASTKAHESLVFVTRLLFPEIWPIEDIKLLEKSHYKLFTLKYVIQGSSSGQPNCQKRIKNMVPNHRRQEAYTLEALTGWPSHWIFSQMGMVGVKEKGAKREWGMYN